MKIVIGSDHAGLRLKEALVPFLRNLGYRVTDKGPNVFHPQDDYPDYIAPVARAVAKDQKNTRGIVIGGSGQGEAMVANRFKGVRAAVYYGGQPDVIALSRQHNDSNVLSLGARFVDEELAKEVTKRWLETKFSGEEKHVRRISKIRHLTRRLWGR